MIIYTNRWMTIYVYIYICTYVYIKEKRIKNIFASQRAFIKKDAHGFTVHFARAEKVHTSWTRWGNHSKHFLQHIVKHHPSIHTYIHPSIHTSIHPSIHPSKHPTIRRMLRDAIVSSTANTSNNYRRPYQ